MEESTHIYALLRDNWPRSVVLNRIENTAVSGIPDLHGWYGKDFWVEMKIEDSPGSFDLRPSQNAWFVRRTKAGGGNHWVLTRFENTLTLWRPRLDDGLIFSVAGRFRKPFDYAALLHRITE